MKTYYAIQWTYGRASDTKTGNPIGTYHAFKSVDDRSIWIDDAKTPYMTQGGARESVLTKIHGIHIRAARAQGELIEHGSYATEKKAWGEIVDTTL